MRQTFTNMADGRLIDRRIPLDQPIGLLNRQPQTRLEVVELPVENP